MELNTYQEQAMSTRLPSAGFNYALLGLVGEVGELFSLYAKGIRDDDGIRRTVEVPKKIRAWWWNAENGKIALNVRYGARVVEISKGKTAIEVATPNDLIPTLELIKKAVDAGELDVQLETASVKLREGFVK